MAGGGSTPDPVESALAAALFVAAEKVRAGEPGALDVVTVLAKELDARRKARANTVDLAAERAKRC